MPTLANIEQCTGCAACSNACAHDAIKMQEDKEGFLHPVIDNSVCIHCGLCEKVCPVNHPVSLGKPSPVVYALWSEKDRLSAVVVVLSPLLPGQSLNVVA